MENTAARVMISQRDTRSIRLSRESVAVCMTSIQFCTTIRDSFLFRHCFTIPPGGSVKCGAGLPFFCPLLP